MVQLFGVSSSNSLPSFKIDEVLAARLFASFISLIFLYNHIPFSISMNIDCFKTFLFIIFVHFNNHGKVNSFIVFSYVALKVEIFCKLCRTVFYNWRKKFISSDFCFLSLGLHFFSQVDLIF